ncbi:MAG: hypothetical protein JO100_11200 [Pseudonocardia sp.]|nr:hypothetical protein [Pseudonocardia sp.]
MSGTVGGHNIQIGQVDGDLSILLDRDAVRLEYLTPTPPRRVSRSRNSPSHLLNPVREIVGYQPRPADEALIDQWLDQPDEDVSVLMLTGLSAVMGS